MIRVYAKPNGRCRYFGVALANFEVSDTGLGTYTEKSLLKDKSESGSLAEDEHCDLKASDNLADKIRKAKRNENKS